MEWSLLATHYPGLKRFFLPHEVCTSTGLFAFAHFKYRMVPFLDTYLRALTTTALLHMSHQSPLKCLRCRPPQLSPLIAPGLTFKISQLWIPQQPFLFQVHHLMDKDCWFALRPLHNFQSHGVPASCPPVWLNCQQLLLQAKQSPLASSTTAQIGFHLQLMT